MTDDFTEAARRHSRELWTMLDQRIASEEASHWARTYLAEQEATDDAVCDLIENRLHDAMFTACVQEPDGETTTYVDAPLAEVIRIARDALSAARNSRRVAR